MSKEANEKLLIGCYKGSTSEIEEALKEGADIDYKDGDPLIYVIKGNAKNKLEVLEFLRERGADLSIWDGISIIWAVRKNNKEVLEYLIKNGVNPEGQERLAIMEALLDKNVELLSVFKKYNVALDGDPECKEELDKFPENLKSVLISNKNPSNVSIKL